MPLSLLLIFIGGTPVATDIFIERINDVSAISRIAQSCPTAVTCTSYNIIQRHYTVVITQYLVRRD